MSLLEKISLRAKVLTDSRHRAFFLQRAVTDIGRRERKADAIASRLPRFQTRAPTPADEQVKRLKQDGYVHVEGLIKPEWLPEMVQYFRQSECADPYRPQLGAFRGPENIPRETHVAFFSNEIVARAPHVFEIANNPRVLATVAGMLGSKPTISYMTTWWSVPAADGGAEHAEKFHRDVDDLRFVKLFCYLTDVDETSGPHMFVRGSHSVNKLTEIRRFSDDEVASTFGPENLVRFTGPAGTTFLENTYGVHRGIPVAKTPRLIYQVLYSLRPTIYGPKQPVAKIGRDGVPADIDPFINRVYCAA